MGKPSGVPSFDILHGDYDHYLVLGLKRGLEVGDEVDGHFDWNGACCNCR